MLALHAFGMRRAFVERIGGASEVLSKLLDIEMCAFVAGPLAGYCAQPLGESFELLRGGLQDIDHRCTDWHRANLANPIGYCHARQ